jgi:transposase
VAWLCQHTDKTTVTKLLRTSWETVAGIVSRVVAEHVDGRRLENIYRIGVDEVSYRKGHRYLTVVGIPAFVTLSRTIRANRDRILAAVELSLSNSKLEGLNSEVRLINHRGYGHHTAAACVAMIYLCYGGITVELPTGR